MAKKIRQHRVVAQTGSRIGRKLFEGNEDDARRYVEQNYPRFHVDENTVDTDNPVHDVKLVSPDGTEQVYHADHGWIPVPDYEGDDELVTDTADEE